ncbi:hypothetical protein [Nonomuraea rubra]|uniref:hypothetical protein n=1 Tax=Nonomuraea rubra TaxID=46180 RepID=UPI0031F036D1
MQAWQRRFEVDQLEDGDAAEADGAQRAGRGRAGSTRGHARPRGARRQAQHGGLPARRLPAGGRALPCDWLSGRPGPEPLPASPSSDKATVSAAKQAAVRWILRRTAARGTAPETTDPDAALRLDARRRALLLRRYRGWLAGG